MRPTMTRTCALSRRTALAGLGLALAAPALPLQAAATEPPRRVVAAGGVITEIAYALGRERLLAGVDSTSLFPAEALKGTPNIGYVRALSAEGILSLRPDLLIAIEGAGPPDVLRLIAEAGIRIVTIPEDLSEAGIGRRIRAVGAALGADAEAETLAARVEARFAALGAERARMPRRPRVLFVLSLQNGRVLVGGRESSADAAIALAGGQNAAAAVQGFKPISDEAIIAAAPEIVVMMARGDHAVPADELFRHPAFALVPAARSRALVTMDGLYLLGFGPRTPDAARELMQALLRHAGAAAAP